MQFLVFRYWYYFCWSTDHHCWPTSAVSIDVCPFLGSWNIQLLDDIIGIKYTLKFYNSCCLWRYCNSYCLVIVLWGDIGGLHVAWRTGRNFRLLVLKVCLSLSLSIPAVKVQQWPSSLPTLTPRVVAQVLMGVSSVPVPHILFSLMKMDVLNLTWILQSSTASGIWTIASRGHSLYHKAMRSTPHNTYWKGTWSLMTVEWFITWLP